MRRYSVTTSPKVVRTLPPWYLSLTIDTSLLIGGRWWGARRGTHEGLAHDRVPPLALDHPDLARWADALAPALLRVGGTEADRIQYGFRNDGTEIPDSEGFILKGKLWRQLNEWVAARRFGLVFTVGAGPDSRVDGRWDARGAERLLRNTVRKGYPVAAWEFGNEVNAHPLLYGLNRGSTRRYLQDFALFAALVRRVMPEAKTVGPASAIWPLIGEPNPLLPALGRSPAAAFLDVMSLHYYPQQSSRGRVAVRRAREGTLLSAHVLDGARRWVRYAHRCLARGPAAGSPLWVTETGHALYGGEPGLSDTWLSTPWWLDQLGLMAFEGVEAVFRQALVGGDYGLLDQQTFVPRSDYFASVLWKRCMGPDVHERPVVRGPDRRLRAWHHSAAGRSCLLVINLSRTHGARVDVGEGFHTVRLLEPLGGPTSRAAVLNGLSLTGPEALSLVHLPPLPAQGPVLLPPLSCAFVESAS